MKIEILIDDIILQARLVQHISSKCEFSDRAIDEFGKQNKILKNMKIKLIKLNK